MLKKIVGVALVAGVVVALVASRPRGSADFADLLRDELREQLVSGRVRVNDAGTVIVVATRCERVAGVARSIGSEARSGQVVECRDENEKTEWRMVESGGQLRVR